MRTFSKSTIVQFSNDNAQAKEELSIWYHIVSDADWKDYNALRQDFPSCDYIGNDRFIFNIKGNHYRLLAMIFFERRKVYIRKIFTHADYDKQSKKDLQNL